MSLSGVVSTITNERSAFTFLQDHGILHRHRLCTCLSAMSVRWRDGDRRPSWRCPQKNCRKEICARKGTWLEGTRLELKNVVLFLFFWSQELTSARFCSRTLGMCKRVTSEWNVCVREIISRSLLSSTIILGGPGRTIEIDESVFSKRKFNVGRRRAYQWVLGAVCRETRECFLVPVRNRKRRTLIPIIRQHVRRGSVIITDGWRAYARLRNEGYVHLTVNHSQNFVDPETGAHTQTIESLWAQVKRQNKARCGTRRTMLQSHLDEFMWRRKLRPGDDRFLRILETIAATSPPR